MSTPQSKREMAEAWMALARAAHKYCDAYRRDCCPIGDDGYAGEYMADILNALIKLLSAEIGNLDGGDCDRYIRSIAEEHNLVDKNGDISG